MTKIKIVTDSTAGLTPEEVAKYDIHILPLTVEIDGQTYDATDIEPADFMAKMAASKQLPKSSQPAIGNIVALFEELTADGSEVLAIHLTEKLSGTVLTAQQAADMVDGKVTVIDSDYIARGLAFQVVEAAKMAQAGTASVDEILTKISKIRAKTKLYICVVTLENLIKGGRVGKMQGIIGSLLNIKLIAKLTDGALVEEAKIRSSKKTMAYLVDVLKAETNKVKELNVVHANGLKMAEEIREQAKEIFHLPEVLLLNADSVISTHAGNGAFAVIYYTE
ncbi:DegV family protein [Listeria weihenstephanensis FSL R9-0317]|uniref:DegV domain-containing protein n=1 Tax=Listeria weihenstephanensis TaxID=1006155 RepID=A0A1S7FTS6_9LIST|nr:DegV family protein [Listeria weihenstephanensis]AQY50844.1 DegV domain-containing protein [Listeria weihenstephanensis]EUJ35695.1 DegV family protein [Listeria weihenstephanensis FSL R9-0317]MBC1501407.1 DegV family protein [Listeria weihenstephanensis]